MLQVLVIGGSFIAQLHQFLCGCCTVSLSLLYSKISLNLTHGTGQVPNYWIFQIIGWYQWWPKFLRVMVCYCSYTWSVKLIRGAFHLNVSLICWLRVIRALFCVFWSLYSCRSLWSRRQGVRRLPQWLMYGRTWRPFLTCPWDVPVSLMQLFSGEKQKLPILGLLSSHVRLSGFLNTLISD